MMKIEQSVNADEVTYRITIPTRAFWDIRNMDRRTCEFNPNGGIALDFVEGGWNEDDSPTDLLDEELLSHKLMCLAFVVAHEENGIYPLTTTQGSKS